MSEDGDGRTKRELYERARELEVPGRSSMSKSDLAEAVDAADVPAGRSGSGRFGVAARYEEFERFARDVASGAAIAPPRMLSAHDRRLHVRQTIREDHETRIMTDADDARTKFDELDGSLFSFFRGTCLLFYRDLAGEDAWMPTVLALGDVHPENFGVMPSADNVPIFGVNDFDEAYWAPFTWDVKRGAVGFMLAASEIADLSSKHQVRIARRFVEGYVDGIEEFGRDTAELERQVRYDNAPELIRDLIDDARDDRAEWLVDEYHDEYGRGFRPTDEIVPITSRAEEFQDLVDRWVVESEIEVPQRAGEMRVKDVAIRRGQGTASLGLSRYYVMIEGERADATDDILIEFKRARRSALAGLVPPSGLQGVEYGDRIARAQGVQLVRADVFYGSAEFEGVSYVTRERAPYRDDIDLDDLSKKGWRRYASICGRALAHAHALSDETPDMDYDIESLILEAVAPRDLFVDDVVSAAEVSLERIRADHEHYRRDHALGAFDTVDHRYR
ncbi:DUF2252 family protein [Ilumatobacter sp.]|uniref:DUF2252 family protein n=1 Tax=Ilumatobacter sp. TaxID=1967498 RepID=UPI003B52A521